MATDRLNILIDADSRKAVTEFNRLQSELNQTQHQSTTFNKALGGLKGGLAALGVGVVVKELGQFGKESLAAAGNVNNLMRGLEQVEGSSLAAEKRFRELYELMKTPGLDGETLIKYDAILKNNGNTARENDIIFTGLAKAVTTFGGNMHDVNGALHQYQQAQSKGKILTQDFRALIERTNGAFLVAARNVHGFNGSVEEMRADFEASGKTFNQYMEPIFVELNKLPGAEMTSYTNLVGNLDDAFKLLQAEIGQKLLPTFKSWTSELIEGIENLTDFIKGEKDAGEATRELGETLSNTQDIEKRKSAIQSYMNTLSEQSEEYFLLQGAMEGYAEDIGEIKQKETELIQTVRDHNTEIIELTARKNELSSTSKAEAGDYRRASTALKSEIEARNKAQATLAAYTGVLKLFTDIGKDALKPVNELSTEFKILEQDTGKVDTRFMTFRERQVALKDAIEPLTIGTVNLAEGFKVVYPLTDTLNKYFKELKPSVVDVEEETKKLTQTNTEFGLGLRALSPPMEAEFINAKKTKSVLVEYVTETMSATQATYGLENALIDMGLGYEKAREEVDRTSKSLEEYYKKLLKLPDAQYLGSRQANIDLAQSLANPTLRDSQGFSRDAFNIQASGYSNPNFGQGLSIGDQFGAASLSAVSGIEQVINAFQRLDGQAGETAGWIAEIDIGGIVQGVATGNWFQVGASVFTSAVNLFAKSQEEEEKERKKRLDAERKEDRRRARINKAAHNRQAALLEEDFRNREKDRQKAWQDTIARDNLEQQRMNRLFQGLDPLISSSRYVLRQQIKYTQPRVTTWGHNTTLAEANQTARDMYGSEAFDAEVAAAGGRVLPDGTVLTKDKYGEIIDIAKKAATRLKEISRDLNRALEDAEKDHNRNMEDIATDYSREVIDIHTEFARELEEIDKELGRDLRDIDTDLKRDLRDNETELTNDLRDINTDYNREKRDNLIELNRDLRDIAIGLSRDLSENQLELTRNLRNIDTEVGRDLIKINKEFRRELKEIDKEFSRDIRDINTELKRDLRDIDVDYERERRDNHKEFLRDLRDIDRDHAREMAEIRKELGRDLVDINKELNRDFADINIEYNRELEEIEKEYGRDIRDINTDLDRDLRDIATENARELEDIEIERARSIEDINKDHARKMLEISDDLNQDLIDKEQDRFDAIRDIHRSENEKLEDLKTRLARRLFGDDIVSFDDLSSEQQAQLMRSTEYKRGAYDIGVRTQRSQRDLREDHGVLTPGSAGYNYYLNELKEGRLTDKNEIRSLFGREGEQLYSRYVASRATAETDLGYDIADTNVDTPRDITDVGTDTTRDTVDAVQDNIDAKADARQDRIDAREDARQDKMDARQDARIDAGESREDARQDARDARSDVRQDRIDAREDARQDKKDANEDALQEKIDSRTDARQDAIDARSDARQDRLDARFDAGQDRRDAKEDLRVEANYDREDARQDKIDADADARQDAIDARTDARQDKIDADADALQDKLDSRSDARQDKIDSDTALRQSAVDSREDARQDAIDARTDARIDKEKALFDNFKTFMISGIDEKTSYDRTVSDLNIGYQRNTDDLLVTATTELKDSLIEVVNPDNSLIKGLTEVVNPDNSLIKGLTGLTEAIENSEGFNITAGKDPLTNRPITLLVDFSDGEVVKTVAKVLSKKAAQGEVTLPGDNI